MKIKHLFTVVFLLLGTIIFAQSDKNTHTKEGKKIVQFHGLVLEGDSLYGVAGASVFDPINHRGATTSLLGYFSFPAVEGDSIIIRAIGFRGRSVRIPEIPDSVDTYFMKIMLSQDTIVLPEVTLGGLPPEQVFKDAVLAYSEVYDKELNNADKNLNHQIMTQLLNNSTMTSGMNHAYYMQQQVQYIENRYLFNSLSVLDPFAWNRFFKDVERNRAKKKAEAKKKNNVKPY